MAILKKGSWVMAQDGKLGQITLESGYGVGYYLVDFKDKTFARNIHRTYLTPIDPAFNNLLTVVNESEET